MRKFDLCLQHFWANYEVNAVCGFLEYHLSLEMPESVIEDEEKKITTRWTPLGVVGAICPWNFPLILSYGKIAPAMITGNTIVIKASRAMSRVHSSAGSND